MHVPEARRLPVGAELRDDGTDFRVWAPRRTNVEVVYDDERTFFLQEEGSGYFRGLDPLAKAGARYRFRLDNSLPLYPDPASRMQPHGPHGPSQIIDSRFPWKDTGWNGLTIMGQILYEMHVGTFTHEGTWNAAALRLEMLVDLGVTAIEVMPVADFPGSFGWGYDGVGLFAPVALYGSPCDFKRFIDRCHTIGLGVILDVVYNHIGPDGNYLPEFSDTYFTDRYGNEWGSALNFDGPGSGPVREFFIANACYWISEFHLDGLRLDATQQIFDSSPEYIVTELVREARRTAGGRGILVVGENERQDANLVRSQDRGGSGLDALWNDDFHHSARVALTGRCEAYYSDHAGNPQEFISLLKWGFLYQGQRYEWQKSRRGTPALDIPSTAFVTFIENHDQVANSGRGLRLSSLASPAKLRAITALLLLGPNTPMLFQGQEFGSSAPFTYFADHGGTLGAAVARGRLEFLRQFPSIAESIAQAEEAFLSPSDRKGFEICKLDCHERDSNTSWLALHRDLIQLRKSDGVFRAQRSDWMNGAVLSPESFVLRFFGQQLGDRLMLINFGRDLALIPASEPLLAPPANTRWQPVWASESIQYGGCGRDPEDAEGRWFLTAESAVVLTSVSKEG